MTDGTGHRGTCKQEEGTGDKDITETDEGGRRLKHRGEDTRGI